MDDSLLYFLVQTAPDSLAGCLGVDSFLGFLRRQPPGFHQSIEGFLGWSRHGPDPIQEVLPSGIQQNGRLQDNDGLFVVCLVELFFQFVNLLHEHRPDVWPDNLFQLGHLRSFRKDNGAQLFPINLHNFGRGKDNLVSEFGHDILDGIRSRCIYSMSDLVGVNVGQTLAMIHQELTGRALARSNSPADAQNFQFVASVAGRHLQPSVLVSCR
mmetsp:Transcript_3056/g.6365  ORF Transcript_3056/g.6365 Transcript_3056/m.6365 type:complete len:212 (+) Transcript_3056:2541-3176(+)